MGVMVQLSNGKALRVVFALCLLALFAWMTWEAFLGYGKESPSAATFPRAILIPAIGLAAIAVFREITASRAVALFPPTLLRLQSKLSLNSRKKSSSNQRWSVSARSS